jgi:hypothetical protein
MSLIQLKRGTASRWSTINPILKNGELGIETDTKKIKLGNGTSQWNSLNYINIVPEDLGNTLDSYIESSEKGNAGGVATLNSSGVIPDSQISPTIARYTEIITSYNNLDDLPELFSGSYTDLTEKPTLFSGSYEDLSNKPTIPSLDGYATESYVGTAISNLVDSAPETLNTLNELAEAINDDASYAATITTALGEKEPLLPEQAENNGKFLTTNGTAKSWAIIPSATPTSEGTVYGKTTSADTTAIGYEAGLSLTTANGPTLIGYKAGYSNTSGNGNHAFGRYALYSATTAANNLAVGSGALYSIVSTNQNTGIGSSSGTNTTGTNNTFLGYNSGSELTTGSGNVILGYNAQPSAVGASNEVTIGDTLVTKFRVPGLAIDWTDTRKPMPTTISTALPTGGEGENGDIWITYTP